MFELSDKYYHMVIPQSGMGDMIRGYLDVLYRWRRIPRPIKIYTFESKISLMDDIIDLFIEQPLIEYVIMTREGIPEPWYTAMMYPRKSLSRTHVLVVADKQHRDYRPIKTKQQWSPGQDVAVYHTNFKTNYGENLMLKNLSREQWEAIERRTLTTNNKLLGLPLTFKQSVDILLNCRYVVGIEGGWTHVAQLFEIPYYIICNEPNLKRKFYPKQHHTQVYRYFEQMHLITFEQGMELIN